MMHLFYRDFDCSLRVKYPYSVESSYLIYLFLTFGMHEASVMRECDAPRSCNKMLIVDDVVEFVNNYSAVDGK